MDIQEKIAHYYEPNLVYMDSFSLGYSESRSDDSMQPYGQISTDDLTLYFDLFYVATDGILDFILVYFYYNWERMPTFRWQDPIAISWDDTKFRLHGQFFHKADKYSCVIPNLDGSHTWVFDELYSFEDGYAIASPAGVAWYADLKGDVGMVVTELYGYGSFRLTAAHGTTIYEGESSTLYAHYVHPTASLSASINVAAFGSFSVSCAGGYDERGTHHTFTIMDSTTE